MYEHFYLFYLNLYRQTVNSTKQQTTTTVLTTQVTEGNTDHLYGTDK